MTYEPNLKPGDKVTSPLLVGEWEVTHIQLHTGCRLRRVDPEGFAYIQYAYLTPVAPPEPGLGEVVWAAGFYWCHHRAGWSLVRDGNIRAWAFIANNAEPVVPVSKVADWLTAERLEGTAEAFRAEFGWDR